MYYLPMKKKDAKTISKQDMTTLRRLARDNQVQALREGRKNRAATFTDRKKEGSKRICRGKVRY